MVDLDWPSIEADFTQTLETVRSIAGKHGVNESTIRSRAKAKGWVRHARNARNPSDGAAEAFPMPTTPYELADLARSLAPLALETLRDVAAYSKSEAARVAAAIKLLEIGFGKPMGIAGGDGGSKRASREPAEPNAPAMGKKETLIHNAKNPDQSTTMGSLMARRLRLVKDNEP